MLSRALLVLLLALNLGVAVWSLTRASPQPSAALAQSAGVARLQLASEVPRRAPPAPAPVSATTTDGAGDGAMPVGAQAATREAIAPRCFSLGPFPTDAAAQTARAVLPSSLPAVRAREQPQQVRGGWSVLMPPQIDRAAAQALAARIEAAGFKDYYVVGEGPQAHAIALGRYTSEDAARRHQAALLEAGFAARIEAPVLSRASYWLDVDAAPDFDPDAARTATGADSIEQRACGQA